MSSEIFASDPALLFPFERTLHQPPDRFLRRRAGMQHLEHLFRDRHLDGIPLAAKSTAAFVVLMPSATIFMELTISSSFRPWASSIAHASDCG